MIEILDDDSQATVQDRGRYGWRRFGVGSSGAMDGLALERANLLAGNADDAAAIEVPGTPLRLQFCKTVRFALAGSDAQAMLDDLPVLPDSTQMAVAGATLRLDRPTWGTYAYVAVAGGIDVPVVLGSKSTHVRGEFGGYLGRVLRRGDRLAVGPAADARTGSVGLEAARTALALKDDQADVTHVRVLPAAEHDLLSTESLDAFWSTKWKISAQSNRSGYRLSGPTLNLATSIEMRSHGLLPGVIQAPTGGPPIIQLADAFTAGGYPKIGTVIAADLWRVAQAPLGTALRFVPVDYAAALGAEDALDDYRRKTRLWIDLCRDRNARGPVS